MLAKPQCSVIIPAFGPSHFLDACLNSLANDNESHEIVVIDNGVGYDLPDWVVPIRNVDNTGFARACNDGTKIASSDLLCFFNCDAMATPGWLTPLVSAFDDPMVAMSGPRIIHPGGDLQTSGIRTWHGSGNAGGEEIKQELPTRDVDGVTGACMVIRRDVLNAAGGWCELYRQGYEDVDLCLTVRLMGLTIRYIQESTVVHHESATGPERWQFTHQNVALMNQRWGNR